jgi:SAM-dependent MidA family methyltransferase
MRMPMVAPMCTGLLVTKRHARTVTTPAGPRPWVEAWTESLYGPSGFFKREVPGKHFRTNIAYPLFGEAVRRLAEQTDEELGFPDPFDVVDVGAGRGELLRALGEVPARWRLTGVEVAEADVPFRWLHEIPSLTGLLIANEWLDNVPTRVIEDGRLVLVDESGKESLGEPVTSAWADAWWPGGGRVEDGEPRDVAWQQAVNRVRRGVVVAVDYGHTSAGRRPTLTGYRDGRQVPPVPDGSCDLTAHVALDSCANATGATLLTQAAALRALGISAALPAADASSYPLELERASQARALLDPQGLGGFGWLVQPVGIDPGWMPG